LLGRVLFFELLRFVFALCFFLELLGFGADWRPLAVGALFGTLTITWIGGGEAPGAPDAGDGAPPAEGGVAPSEPGDGPGVVVGGGSAAGWSVSSIGPPR